jgi:hypothetical protein
MMDIKEFDRVRLKDGREGTIVCICEPDKLYSLDIGTAPGTWDNIFIKPEEIEKRI